MDIRGHTVNKVLVAPACRIDHEFYLGVVLDRAAAAVVVMASAEGGVDIEEVARERPEKIVAPMADPFLGLHPYQAREVGFALGIAADKVAGFAAIALKLYKAYVDEDATLAEINPLILTERRRVAGARLQDELRRQRALPPPRVSKSCATWPRRTRPSSKRRRSGISFVKLDGNIGCIVNGAGLAMATMDAVKLHGGEPANFLDVGGGASAEQVAKAFGLVTADPNVQGDPDQHLRRHHPRRCGCAGHPRSARPGRGRRCRSSSASPAPTRKKGRRSWPRPG